MVFACLSLFFLFFLDSKVYLKSCVTELKQIATTLSSPVHSSQSNRSTQDLASPMVTSVAACTVLSTSSVPDLPDQQKKAAKRNPGRVLGEPSFLFSTSDRQPLGNRYVV